MSFGAGSDARSVFCWEENLSVLIVSLPGDAHSLATKWALENKGIEVFLISWSDYPQLHKSSFAISNDNKIRLSMTHQRGSYPIEQIETVWLHRTLKGTPHPSIHPADHAPIIDSAEHYFHGLIGMWDTGTFLVNSGTAKWRFGNKLNQLAMAKNCGFKIPSTLISNDLAEIDDFVQSNGECIVKPLKFMVWNCGSFDVQLFTSVLTKTSNHDPLSFEGCPMIYQERIQKVCEYRVVVFGGEILCFQLDSQISPDSTNDWRTINYHDLPAQLVQTPKQIIRPIYEFMSKCDFVYGSFDFALCPNGDVVFFEFNETGQFLWLEELCPDVPLLDMFAEFLINARANFVYTAAKEPAKFKDWLAEFPEHVAQALASHVPVSLDKRFSENPPSATLA